MLPLDDQQQSCRDCHTTPATPPLKTGLRLERALGGLTLLTPEARQGLEDFLAKRGRTRVAPAGGGPSA